MTPRLDGLGPLDTARVLAGVVFPLIARGLIVRRPPVVRLLESLDADRRAVHLLQQLDERRGPGPLVLHLPGRRIAIVLDPQHARRVLHETPHPFSPATWEKVHALAQFQPAGVLVSRGEERSERRRFNEAVLDTHARVHQDAATLVSKVVEEARALRTAVDGCGRLDWPMFIEAWYRTVRRVVLGDAAADDHLVTDVLGRLRAGANWSFVRRSDTRLRRGFLHRLQAYVDRAEPGSLASRVAAEPQSSRTEAVQQIPQWLFAFDPAGMATYRALALLAAHPTYEASAQDEIAAATPATIPEDASAVRYPTLAASVLESLRLWPTTPAILRECRDDVRWDDRVLEAGSGILIFAPFFHRDRRRLDEADAFAPKLWSADGQHGDAVLVPFSGGTAVCPGRNLVLLLTSTLLATLMEGRRFVQCAGRRPTAQRPLPSVLDPFRIAFDVHRVP